MLEPCSPCSWWEFVALIVRRRWLSRSGGTFEASIRVRSTKSGRGWVLGLGRYTGARLEWFRALWLSPRPKESFARVDLEVVGCFRTPFGSEAFALYSGHVVIECRTPAGQVELAMSEDSLTGLLSWLEAGPSGRTALLG